MKTPLFLLSLAYALPLAAKGPPNDDFAKAISLNVKKPLPYTQTGSLTDELDRFRATKQDGEPNHAGRAGKGSVWYSWKCHGTRRIEVSAKSESMELLLAAYTGSSVDDLNLIQRYDDFAEPAFSRKRSESFAPDTRIEFIAQKGKTYYFAVDTENEIFEEFEITMRRSYNPLKPILELVPEKSQWEFLIARDEEGNPTDPKSLDPDFYHTWMFPDRYNGPKFLEGLSPIGYGLMESFKVRSNLLGKRGEIPPAGKRYTAYCRTSFTPAIDLTRIGIEGLFDDGVIIYVNGREGTRINVSDTKDPQDWKTVAHRDKYKDEIITENAVQYRVVNDLNLSAGEPVNLSLSLHNLNSESSDLAMNLRVFALAPKSSRVN